MHGTFVQDRRLERNVTHRLKDGETVTFGVHVTRAQGTSLLALSSLVQISLVIGALWQLRQRVYFRVAGYDVLF